MKLRQVVAICTRNRPADLQSCLNAITQSGFDGEVIVVDASDEEMISEVGRVVSASTASARLLIAPEIGLARQRNFALNQCFERYDVIHFLDDDAQPSKGYFVAIERQFVEHQDVGGVGGVVLNQEPVRLSALKCLFLLHSGRPGAMLRSGRNVIGHYPWQGDQPRNVDWLPGCCMSYRLSACRGLTFDTRLRGYSWGEDFDFSNRLARSWRLAIEPRATCMHNLSPVNRTEAGQLAFERTLILSRWVQENSVYGYSSTAFWWSVLGEISLRGLHGLRDPSSRAIAAGVLRAATDLTFVSRRSPRR